MRTHTHTHTNLPTVFADKTFLLGKPRGGGVSLASPSTSCAGAHTPREIYGPAIGRVAAPINSEKPPPPQAPNRRTKRRLRTGGTVAAQQRPRSTCIRVCAAHTLPRVPVPFPFRRARQSPAARLRPSNSLPFWTGTDRLLFDGSRAPSPPRPPFPPPPLPSPPPSDPTSARALLVHRCRIRATRAYAHRRVFTTFITTRFVFPSRNLPCKRYRVRPVRLQRAPPPPVTFCVAPFRPLCNARRSLRTSTASVPVKDYSRSSISNKDGRWSKRRSDKMR